MSITATLFSAEPSPSAPAIAAIRARESGLLSIVVVSMPKQHFITDDYGLDPKVFVQFALHKAHSSESRAELALAIREFLVASERDALLKYIDVPVIRRVGDSSLVAPGYEQFAPESAGWLVAPIETPGG
jgi:hypothetical protein